jgi:hypothetical protein
MSVPRLVAIEFLIRLRRPGAAGMLLLLAALGYTAAVLAPARSEVEAMQARAAHAQRRATAAPAGSKAAPGRETSGRDLFYGALPPSGQVTQAIERIYAAASAEQLSLLNGEYTSVDVPSARLVRYRLVLPLHGTYTQVQRFVAEIGTAVPGLFLEDLSLQRQNVAESQVQARVQVSIFLAKP